MIDTEVLKFLHNLHEFQITRRPLYFEGVRVLEFQAKLAAYDLIFGFFATCGSSTVYVQPFFSQKPMASSFWLNSSTMLDSGSPDDPQLF